MKNTLFQKIPAKSNGDLFSQINETSKKSFSIDYLNLNLIGTFQPIDNADIKFTKNDSSTKIFKNIHVVHIDGFKIGTILSKPASSALDPLLVQFKVENFLFYSMPLIKLKGILKNLFKYMRLSFTSVNRLDLALDVEDDKDHTQELLKNLVNNDIRISGRSKSVKPFYYTDNGYMILEGCAIGSRSSSRFLRIYDKTREMQANPKQYIQAYHNRIGFNQKVWRFEYQLNSKFLRDKKDVNIDSLFDINFLYALYTQSYTNHFSFKENTNKKQCNDEKDFSFLDFEKIRKQFEYLKTEIITLKRKINETLIGQKRMVKSLCRSYFSTTKPSYALPIPHILNSYGLNDWFDSKFPSYLEEFMNKALNNKFDTYKFFKLIENEA